MAAARVMTAFELPVALEAAEPPEARGLRRDEVRLLVSNIEKDSIEHARFHDLPRWLSAGDLLVVNTSGTLNAALSATTDTGETYELHLSTRLPGSFWTLEVRQTDGASSRPYRHTRAGTTFRLPEGGHAALLAPYPLIGSLDSPSRLWMAAVNVPGEVPAYLDRYGFPIRYSYVKRPWPSSMYQTVFATEPGSAEMPSAGRPFTPELVTRLVSRGVQVAPLLLHTGVASLEFHEPPTRQCRQTRRPPRRSRRNDGGSCARNRYRRTWDHRSRRRLDQSCDYAGTATAIRQCLDYWTARASCHSCELVRRHREHRAALLPAKRAD